MSLKKILSVTLALTMTLAISGCGNKTKDTTSKGGKITLEFWNPFTGPDGEYMKNLVEKYNGEHKDKVEVKMQVTPGDQYYEKLKTSVRSGQGPQVAVVHADQIPGLVRNNTLKELDSDINSLGVKGEDYIESAWKAGVYKEKRYTIPLDVHPLVLYYNKDIVKKEGLKVPTTYEELVQNAKKATKGDVYGFALPTIWPTNLVFRTAMLQNGSDVISNDSKESVVNNEIGMTAFNKINDLWAKEKVAPEKLPRDGHINLFKQNKVAFTIDGIWMMQGFTEAKVNYGVASMTTLFGNTPAVWANSHQLSVINNKNMNDETKKEALNFIKYISENAIEWAKGGQVPANKKVLESEEFKKLTNQYEASKELKDTKLAPQVDTWIDIWSPVEANLSEGLLGEKSAKDALNAAAKEGTEKAKATLAE